VNTSGKKQSWTLIGSYSVGTMDDLQDGPIYGKVRTKALDGNGNIDPRATGVLKFGAMTPAWTGQINFEKGTSGGSAYVKWYWSGLRIKRIDFSDTIIPDRAQASGYSNNGYAFSTTYYFYPRANEYLINSAQTGAAVDFVVDTTNGVGVPDKIGVLAGGRTSEASRQQNLSTYMALSPGPIPVPTPASGAGATSGGGGGNDLCIRTGMLVHCLEKGIIPAEALEIGDHILTPEGFRPVLFVDVMPCEEFIRFVMTDGEEIDQDPFDTDGG
jgi:hypothetical protein